MWTKPSVRKCQSLESFWTKIKHTHSKLERIVYTHESNFAGQDLVAKQKHGVSIIWYFKSLEKFLLKNK